MIVTSLIPLVLDIMNEDWAPFWKLGAICIFFFLKKNVIYLFLMFIHFWERETECKWERGRERGRHRIESRLQAPSCQHRPWHRAQTHERRHHDRSEVGHLTDWATRCPCIFFFMKGFSIPVLVFIATITDYQKTSGLKQHKCIVIGFVVRSLKWVSRG